MSRITPEQYEVCEKLTAVVVDWEKVWYQYIQGSTGGVPVPAQLQQQNKTIQSVVTALKKAATDAETALGGSGGGDDGNDGDKDKGKDE